MSYANICISTFCCIPRETSGCGPSKRTRSGREQEYTTEIEENRRRAEVTEEKVIEMENQLKDLQEEQRKINEILKSVSDKMGICEGYIQWH